MDRVKFILVGNNVSPVEKFISSLQTKDQEKVYSLLEVLDENGLKLGMPYVKPLKNCGLYEFRVSYRRNQYRFLMCEYGEFLVLLHGLIEKDEIPQKDIDIAKQRRDDLMMDDD